MANKEEVLKVADYESAFSQILDLILRYPFYPDGFEADNSTVLWNGLVNDTCLGVYVEQEPTYIRKYVSGSYEAKISLQLIFRSSPTTNKASINAQLTLQRLCEWLEQSELTFSDEHMILEDIARTTSVTLINKTDNVTDYAVGIQFRYYYKKGD